jgi:hypothetical protein
MPFFRSGLRFVAFGQKEYCFVLSFEMRIT